MALVQSQQITGNGLGTLVPGPLLFQGAGSYKSGNMKTERRRNLNHELENTIALLERTPAALDALLR